MDAFFGQFRVVTDEEFDAYLLSTNAPYTREQFESTLRDVVRRMLAEDQNM